MTRKTTGIEQLPSGSYRATIEIDGQRQRETFPTKKLAQQWRRLRQSDQAVARAGRGVAPSLRYRDLATAYLDHAQTGPRVFTHRYLESIRTHVRAIVGAWGGRDATRTTARDVHELVAGMWEAGLSASTVRNRLNQLSRLHGYGVDSGLLRELPCKIARPRPVERSQRRATPEPDLDRLVGAAAQLDDPRPLAIILLAADAGLRRAEIGRLHGEDIHRDRIHVAVRSEQERTKSGRGRNVPILTVRLRRALKSLSRRDGHRLIKTDYRSHGAVQDVVNPLWLKVLGTRAQLHELRHRFCSRLADSGEPLVHIMAWAGHRMIETTMRYVHTTGQPTERAGPALESPTQHPRGAE